MGDTKKENDCAECNKNTEKGLPHLTTNSLCAAMRRLTSSREHIVRCTCPDRAVQEREDLLEEVSEAVKQGIKRAREEEYTGAKWRRIALDSDMCE